MTQCLIFISTMFSMNSFSFGLLWIDFPCRGVSYIYTRVFFHYLHVVNVNHSETCFKL